MAIWQSYNIFLSRKTNKQTNKQTKAFHETEISYDVRGRDRLCAAGSLLQLVSEREKPEMSWAAC